MTPNTLTTIRHSDAIALATGGDEIRAGSVGGIALHYDQVNQNGWAVARGALDEWFARDESPVLLWSHLDSEPIGSWSTVTDRQDGIHVRGSLNLKTQRGQEARDLILAGDVTGLSVGIAPAKGGIKIDAGKVTITKADLLEVSIVAIPADRHARIKVAASITDKIAFERFLRDVGFARAAASRMAPAAWSALHPSEQKIQNLAERVQAATAKLKRN